MRHVQADQVSKDGLASKQNQGNRESTLETLFVMFGINLQCKIKIDLKVIREFLVERFKEIFIVC